jgi:DNA-binding NtrC family response regulator
MSGPDAKASLGTIVVVDDENSICHGCRLPLTDLGYTVEVFLEGGAALQSIQRGNYDLVLLDIKLPDVDGMEILKQIRKQKPDTKVIMMTGYASVENAVNTMKLGAFDYLSKPFSADELILTVERAMESKRLAEENQTLKKQLYEKFDFSNIVGENKELIHIFKKIRKAAPTDSTILLEGESGTGKELFAKAVHARSRRASQQFVAVDCSTFSASLLESELFGHVKGAFTGAVKNKPGIFEIADGGTLFLDEVANLSLDVQGKILRVMESKQYKPVGGGVTKNTDMRIIAATNRDLKIMVDDNEFRNDLFYRLNVLPIVIPPLRDRRDDIPKLAYHFLRIFCKKMGRRIQGFSDEALTSLIHHDWPGNVRQLKNVVERLVIMCDDTVLGYRHLSRNFQIERPKDQGAIPGTLTRLKAAKQGILDTYYLPMEKLFLLQALNNTQWNISRAAGQVGMQRSNFSTLMKKHGLAAQTGDPSPQKKVAVK